MAATLGSSGPFHTVYAESPPWEGEGSLGYWHAASEELWDGTYKWELRPKRPLTVVISGMLKRYYSPALKAVLNTELNWLRP